MNLFRAFLSLALSVSVVSLNLEAVALHIHRADAGVRQQPGHHEHGPASHQHQVKRRAPGAQQQYSAVDDDDTAVSVAVTNGARVNARTAPAVPPYVVVPPPPQASHVPQRDVTSLAHGPPGGRPRSLRAPPFSFL